MEARKIDPIDPSGVGDLVESWLSGFTSNDFSALDNFVAQLSQQIPAQVAPSAETPDCAPEKTVNTIASAPRPQKRKRLGKNQTWIFNDSLDVVDPEIEPESKDGKMFVNGREVILQSRLYSESAFEKKQRAPIYVAVCDLHGKNWVFSNNGAKVPLDATAEKIGIKSFTVDGKPIITWGGLMKRPFAFADTKVLLTSSEKHKMVYDDSQQCFSLNDRLITLQQRRKASHSIPKKTHTVSPVPVTSSDNNQNHSISGQVLQSFYTSGNPTLFAGSQSSELHPIQNDNQTFKRTPWGF